MALLVVVNMSPPLTAFLSAARDRHPGYCISVVMAASATFLTAIPATAKSMEMSALTQVLRTFAHVRHPGIKETLL